MKRNTNIIFTEKVSFDCSVLHVAIIDYDFVEERKYRNRADFINEAVREKLEREYGSLEPKLKIEEWWDGDN